MAGLPAVLHLLAGRNAASLPAEAFPAKAGSLHSANLSFPLAYTETERPTEQQHTQESVVRVGRFALLLVAVALQRRQDPGLLMTRPRSNRS